MKLYIVPTPIGNLQDMTFRAIEVLKNVDIILAEDTRTSGKLLKHFEISTHMQSHHMHNEHKTTEALIQRMKAGESFALISDAGTPAISDPGFLLTRECIANNCEYFGEERQVSVSRELTKLYEENIRGTAKEVLAYYQNKPPKGEIVVIVEGKGK